MKTVICKTLAKLGFLKKRLEKEIGIEGILYLPNQMTDDELTDSFIEFVESHHWDFGGGTRYFLDNHSCVFGGCISHYFEKNFFFINEPISEDEEVDKDDVEAKVRQFFKENDITADIEFKLIIDGYYINEDGTRGKYVFDD